MSEPARRAPPEVIAWIHGDFRAALNDDELIKLAAAHLQVGIDRKANPLDNLRIAIASTVLAAAGVTDEELAER